MNQERVFQILLGPHVSEKSAMAVDSGNQYVFKVALDASKDEIKHSVEELFKVKVVKGKTKRNRFGWSKKSDWKKAYVRLADGQEIDFTAIS